MFFIIDERSSVEVKHRLGGFGKVVEFSTDGMVYNAISGHPDIFICQVDSSSVVVAPNTPVNYIQQIEEYGVRVILGAMLLGDKYPNTTCYNALFSRNYLVCNLKHVDGKVLEQVADRIIIDVNQGYVRCNTINLGDDVFITSDIAIYKSIYRYVQTVIYVDPSEIFIHDFKHGFIGGAIGYDSDSKQLFVNGSLNKIKDGFKIIDLCNIQNIKIIELSSTQLYDGGGILVF